MREGKNDDLAVFGIDCVFRRDNVLEAIDAREQDYWLSVNMSVRVEC